MAGFNDYTCVRRYTSSSNRDIATASRIKNYQCKKNIEKINYH